MGEGARAEQAGGRVFGTMFSSDFRIIVEANKDRFRPKFRLSLDEVLQVVQTFNCQDMVDFSYSEDRLIRSYVYQDHPHLIPAE